MTNQNRNAIEQGLEAARQAAQDEGLTNQVEELGNQLQQGTSTRGGNEDGDGTPLAAADGLRFDYDDSSNV